MVVETGAVKLVSGFKLATDFPVISHLQFSNETLIFCAADKDQIQNVKAALLCYETVCGFKVNFFKSELIGARVESHSYLILQTSWGAKLGFFFDNLLRIAYPLAVCLLVLMEPGVGKSGKGCWLARKREICLWEDGSL